MSALARQVVPTHSPRRFSELEVLHEISVQLSTTVDLHSGVRMLMHRALRVEGVGQIILEPLEQIRIFETDLDLPLVWGSSESTSGVRGSALADIAACGRRWGRVRVQFDLKTNALESPLRFSRFLGQQLGGLLNRFDLLRRKHLLVRGQAALRRRIATRKLAERAKGLIAKTRGISEPDALLILIRLSRESRRSIRQVAHSILLPQAVVPLERRV